MLNGYWRKLVFMVVMGMGLMGLGRQALAQSGPAGSCLRTSCASAPLRPGQTAAVQVHWHNAGSATAEAAVGTLALDPALQVVDAAGGTATANGLRWELGDVAAQGALTRTVVVRVPAGTPVGTALRFRAGAEGAALARSVGAELSFKVTDVTSLNDKLAWDMYGNDADGPTDATTSRLIYMIRFQNPGPDTVTSIYVRDTLDSNLDPTTLSVGGSSHMMSTTVNGSAVEFYFPGIYLPDSASNPQASQGYVTYAVDLDPGLPVGTLIQNTAHITFDLDPAFSTNTTASSLCPSLHEDFSYAQSGQTFNFTDLSANDAISWLWNFGDGATSTAQNPSHTYGSLGNYNVCLTVSNLCRTEMVCKQLLLVGRADALPLQHLQIAPNPSAGHFRVAGDLQGRGVLSMQVYDSQGKLVWAKRDRQAPGRLETEIDLTNLSDGIYNLVITIGDKSMTVKLVKG